MYLFFSGYALWYLDIIINKHPSKKQHTHTHTHTHERARTYITSENNTQFCLSYFI